MPIKILDEGFQKLNADSIKKSEIIELMDQYHKNTGKVKQGQGRYNDHKKDEHTTSAWFSLKEIIDFLVANNIDPSPSGDLSKYGIRIYFGMHHKDNSFKPKPYDSRTPMSKFEHKDTLILVATENKGPDKDEDMLNDTNFISIASFNAEEGEGLDNARLCPPECNGGM
jgi:hypothetical protein